MSRIIPPPRRLPPEQGRSVNHGLAKALWIKHLADGVRTDLYLWVSGDWRVWRKAECEALASARRAFAHPDRLELVVWYSSQEIRELAMQVAGTHEAHRDDPTLF